MNTIEMAREAGGSFYIDDTARVLAHWKLTAQQLKAFEAIVRADEREQGQKWFDTVTAQHKAMILAEREACAKLAEQTPKMTAYGASMAVQDYIAAAIRARGEAK
jgi:hypothetical protein